MQEKNNKVDKLIKLLRQVSQSKEGEKKALTIIKNWYKQSKITKAQVISAVPLTKKELETIEKKLAQTFKKPVKAINKIDKKILGGIKIIANFKIIDASIAGRLEKSFKFIK